MSFFSNMSHNSFVRLMFASILKSIFPQAFLHVCHILLWHLIGILFLYSIFIKDYITVYSSQLSQDIFKSWLPFIIVSFVLSQLICKLFKPCNLFYNTNIQYILWCYFSMFLWLLKPLLLYFRFVFVFTNSVACVLNIYYSYFSINVWYINSTSVVDNAYNFLNSTFECNNWSPTSKYISSTT